MACELTTDDKVRQTWTTHYTRPESRADGSQYDRVRIKESKVGSLGDRLHLIGMGTLLDPRTLEHESNPQGDRLFDK